MVSDNLAQALAMPCPTGPTRSGRQGCRCMNVHAASRRYGVSPELLRGLIEGKQIPGHAVIGNGGHPLFKVDRSKLESLLGIAP